MIPVDYAGFLHHLVLAELPSLVSLIKDLHVSDDHFERLPPLRKYGDLSGILSTIALSARYMREDPEKTGCYQGPTQQPDCSLFSSPVEH
eukprot:768098-Prorocentrum_minimum.AAC.1